MKQPGARADRRRARSRAPAPPTRTRPAPLHRHGAGARPRAARGPCSSSVTTKKRPVTGERSLGDGAALEPHEVTQHRRGLPANEPAGVGRRDRAAGGDGRRAVGAPPSFAVGRRWRWRDVRASRAASSGSRGLRPSGPRSRLSDLRLQPLDQLHDDLDALDGVDRQVGFEIEIQVEHLDGVAGPIADDAEQGGREIEEAGDGGGPRRQRAGGVASGGAAGAATLSALARARRWRRRSRRGRAPVSVRPCRRSR